MRFVSLMVIENKIVKLEPVAIFWPDLPVEEGTDRITLHEAVEEPANLARSPDELTLDGRQHELMLVDCIKGFSDGAAGLVQDISPYRLDSLRA